MSENNTTRDDEPKLDKFANISKSKPLQFHHHLHKAIFKKDKLPSMFFI